MTSISGGKVRARRAEFLARKEKLLPDLEALLQAKEKIVP